MTIKKNKIKSIKILENHDDAAYFNRAKGILLPLMVKKQSTNVDAVSGATFSSNGIIKAVRNALSKAAVNKSSSDSSSTSTTKDTTKKDTTEKYQVHTKMVFTKELEQDSEEDHCQCPH